LRGEVEDEPWAGGGHDPRDRLDRSNVTDMVPHTACEAQLREQGRLRIRVEGKTGHVCAERK
jgi:hypothetical protein